MIHARPERPRPASNRFPAVALYGVLAVLAATGIATLSSLSSGWLWLLLAVLLAGFLWLRIWTVPLVVLLIQLDLLATEPAVRRAAAYGYPAMTLAIVFLTFVVVASRYLALADSTLQYYRPGMRSRLGAWLGRVVDRLSGRPSTDMPARATETFSVSELFMGGLYSVLAVAVALAVLNLIPLDPSAPRDTGLIPAAHRMIRIGLTLFLVGAIVYYLVDLIAWQFLSRHEARLFLQTEFTDEHFDDLRRMTDQRLRGRRRRGRQGRRA